MKSPLTEQQLVNRATVGAHGAGAICADDGCHDRQSVG